MSSHHGSEHSESSLLEYKELQAPADCSSSFDKVYTQTQNCNGWWYIRQCSSLTRTIEPSPWSLLKKQLKKNCSIKGRSHISSTWRKNKLCMSGFHNHAGWSTGIRTRSVSNSSINCINKQNKKVPMWAPTAAVSKQRKVNCNQQELGAL